MVSYPDIQKFIKKIGVIRVIVNILLLIALFITASFLLYGISQNVLVVSLLVACIAIVLVFLVFNLSISSKFMYSVVTSLEVTNGRVRVRTAKKNYSFDVERVVSVKTQPRYFTVSFEDQGDVDSVILYRHLPFSEFSFEYFTDEDVRTFVPDFTLPTRKIVLSEDASDSSENEEK